MTIRRMSKAGAIALIYRERARLKIYDKRQPTIGVGHLLTPVERSSGIIIVADARGGTRKLYPYKGLTKSEVELLFLQDIEVRARELNRMIKVPVTQEGFDALMFFAFNIGTPNFRKSRVLAALNGGSDPKQIAAVWRQSFLTSSGVLSSELVDRRRDEAMFWLTGKYEHLVNNQREQAVLAAF